MSTRKMAAPCSKHALNLKILAKCSTTKARTCKMALPHHVVDTPVFMPVGTQGTLKGMIPEQLEELDCQIMLSNTYHLGHRPVSICTVLRLYVYLLTYSWSTGCTVLRLPFCSPDSHKVMVPSNVWMTRTPSFLLKV